MKDFIPIILLHVYNKLSHSVSVSKILETYPTELFENLGMKSIAKERSLFRGLERIGKYFPIILGRYQDFLIAHGLADDKQVIDFSSSLLRASSSYYSGGSPALWR